MVIVWHEDAWADYLWWQSEDRNTLHGINLLVKDVQRNGNEGIGKPEALMPIHGGRYPSTSRESVALRG